MYQILRLRGVREARRDILLCLMSLIGACLVVSACSQKDTQSRSVQAITAGTPTLTGPERDATKNARFDEEQRLAAAEATRFALGTPDPLHPVYIGPTFRPRETPILGINFQCAEASTLLDYAGCWTGAMGGEYIFVATGAAPRDVEQGMLMVYT